MALDFLHLFQVVQYWTTLAIPHTSECYIAVIGKGMVDRWLNILRVNNEQYTNYTIHKHRRRKQPKNGRQTSFGESKPPFAAFWAL